MLSGYQGFLFVCLFVCFCCYQHELFFLLHLQVETRFPRQLSFLKRKSKQCEKQGPTVPSVRGLGLRLRLGMNSG